MDIRGVSLKELRKAARGLQEWSDSSRCLMKSGVSGVRLPNNVFQARTLNGDCQIVREETQLTDEEWLEQVAVDELDACVGDRVVLNDGGEMQNGIVTHVQCISNNTTYTMVGLKKDSQAKHRHEANYAYWAFDLSTQRVEESVFRDRKATTKDALEEIVKPRTKAAGLSYLDVIGETKQATVFISHAWMYIFATVVEAVEENLAEAGFNSETDRVWFDIFTINQHEKEVVREFSWWQTSFRDAIANIGHTMLVLAPWDDPLPLKRSWCLWEVYATIETGSKFTIVMTSKEQQRLLKTLATHFEKVYKVLCYIKCEEAEAGKFTDQENISLAVASGEGGFHRVNRTCVVALQQELLRVCKKALDDKIERPEKVFKIQLIQAAGRLYEEQAKYDEAIKYYTQGLVVNSQVTDACTRMILEAALKCSIGAALTAQRKLVQALDILKDSLNVATKAQLHMNVGVLGSALGLATIYNNIAAIYNANLNVTEAVNNAQKAVHYANKECGHNSETTARAIMGLGNALSNQAQYEQGVSHLFLQAAACYEDALEIRQKLHSENHPLVADALEGLANTCCEQHQWDKALSNFEKSLAIRLKCFGSKHPLVASSYNNISSIYFERKNIPKAMEFAKKSEAIKVAFAENNDPELGQLFYNIGVLHYTMNEYEPALEYGERAMKIYVAVHGASHPKSEQCRQYLAIVREKVPNLSNTAMNSVSAAENEATLLARAIALSMAKDEKEQAQTNRKADSAPTRAPAVSQQSASATALTKKAPNKNQLDHKVEFARLFQENCKAGMPPNKAAAKALLTLKSIQK